MKNDRNGPKIAAVAAGIQEYLGRFEMDPTINKDISPNQTGMHIFYNSRAWSAGCRVYIKYVSYQNITSLSKADALAYLKWLQAGNVGKHYDFERRPEVQQ